MHDFLLRGLIPEIAVRFTCADVGALCNEILIKHDCDPLSGYILCRGLAAGALEIPLLDPGERCSVTWNYPGPIRRIVVDFSATGELRGYTGAKELVGKVASIAQAYGEDDGQLSVVRSREERQVGSSLCAGKLLEVADDLAYFHSVSEQIETDICVALRFNPDPNYPVSLCRGILLQALPGCDHEKLGLLRDALRRPEAQAILEEKGDGDESRFERLLHLLLSTCTGTSYQLFPAAQPRFQCRCSESKTLDMLACLPPEEIAAIKAEGKPLRISCAFCSHTYSIAPERLRG
ncbi:MAG: hypothetical protein RL095_1621 [Verrucomicrobiota bacterium]|jgi:molecular chaperone Hsp33